MPMRAYDQGGGTGLFVGVPPEQNAIPVLSAVWDSPSGYGCKAADCQAVGCNARYMDGEKIVPLVDPKLKSVFALWFVATLAK
jgi:hypothetical protein